MQFFIALAFLAMFAGRALASSFNFSLPGFTGNLSASELFQVNDQQLATDCQSQCQPGMNLVQTCGDNNAPCLCSNDTVIGITACQQCMFADLIHNNRVSNDSRAAGTSTLQIYAAACQDSGYKVNASIALTVPPDWDGNFGAHLNIAATVVTVIAGAALGIGAITIVSTM